MIQNVATTKDVKMFFRELLAEGLIFHPHTSFEDYINLYTKQDTYTKEEAKMRNELLDQCLNVCERHGEDIYDLSIEIFQPFKWD